MVKGDLARPRGGQVGKRRAILDGALVRFARDGYVRASMDGIATEANVSTRTIYNHFQDKSELFLAVIQDSATGMAEAQIALVDRHLRKIVDLPQDLLEFGVAGSRPMPEHANHIALVRQINAEVEHIPAKAIRAWQRTGPRRVQSAIAERVSEWADRGLIHTDDPELSALHLMLLVWVDDTWRQPHQKELTRRVTAGVRTFLYGHAVDSGHRQ